MNLELITRKPDTRARSSPILFVHGAFHAAWCWDEHFLPYFAANGYEAHALSLRGHGESDGRDRLRWTSLADFVSDVASVARSMTRPPIVVGHSLGGAIVQKYLETHDSPAAVLLASVPSNGVWMTTRQFARQDPLAVVKTNLYANLRYYLPVLKRQLFSEDLPPERKEVYFSRLEPNESYRVNVDLALLNLPKPERVRAPVLVMGAANDQVITRDQVEVTARAYRTWPEMFPAMAHSMMLEKGWQAVADRMIAWLAMR